MLPPRIGWKESHYNMSMKDNIDLDLLELLIKFLCWWLAVLVPICFLNGGFGA